jgi:hypothetical protein
MTSPSPSAWDTTRVSKFQGAGCIGKDTGSQSVKLYWMKTSVVSAKLGVELKEQGQTTL